MVEAAGMDTAVVEVSEPKDAGAVFVVLRFIRRDKAMRASMPTHAVLVIAFQVEDTLLLRIALPLGNGWCRGVV